MKFDKIILILILIILSCSSHNLPVSGISNNDYYISSTNGLTLRNEPLTNGKAISIIPFSDKVKIISKHNDNQFIGGAYGSWTQIKWNDKIGWVFGGYLTNIDIPQFKYIAANHCNLQYSKSPYYDDYKKYWGKILNHKPNDIKIIDVKHNYVIIKYIAPSRNVAGEYWENGSLWYFDNDKYHELFTDGHFYLKYLNNDNYIDVISLESYHDGHTKISIFYGNNSKIFNKVYESDFNDGAFTMTSFGRCEKTTFTFYSNNVTSAYYYDCSKNTFTKK